MSIYSALSIDEPVIVYSVLHQMKKGVGEKEYTETIHAMHSAVRSESAKVAQVWEHHLRDLKATAVQATRGNLSQFLTLPLDTDVKEVQRILDDQLTQVLKQTLPGLKIGILASTEGRIIWERDQNSVIQELSARGKEYLAKLKFRTKEENSFIFESDYFVGGGLNLDIIEHIVRDRMGIYDSPHGPHTLQSEPFVFAAHNLVYQRGALETGESTFEAMLHFLKGKVQYATFRKSLTETIESSAEVSGLDHCSVWQRKLGLGGGTEFNLRMKAKDRRIIKEFLGHLVKKVEKNPDVASVITKGSLLLKELLQ